MLLSAVFAANRRKPAPAIDRSKAAVDPIAAFKLRCEARAHLYSDGEFDLHNAVNVLEESARLSGLNRTIGRDAVQQIMAEAFRPIREKDQSILGIWQTAVKALQAPPIIEPETSGTAASTTQALLYALRSGLSCLVDLGARDRLLRCDEAAILDITKELVSWPGKTKDGKDRPWLPAWTREDVETLIKVWRGLT